MENLRSAVLRQFCQRLQRTGLCVAAGPILMEPAALHDSVCGQCARTSATVSAWLFGNSEDIRAWAGSESVSPAARYKLSHVKHCHMSNQKQHGCRFLSTKVEFREWPAMLRTFEALLIAAYMHIGAEQALLRQRPAACAAGAGAARGRHTRQPRSPCEAVDAGENGASQRTRLPCLVPDVGATAVEPEARCPRAGARSARRRCVHKPSRASPASAARRQLQSTT